MATEHIRIQEFADHPVLAAISPMTDDLIELLAHPQAYDPEGDDGEPALVIKGCFRPDGRMLVWIADQCTHSQMSQHLIGDRAPDLREFYILVRPSYESELEARNFDWKATPELARLFGSIDRATLRTRLGRFRRRPSPRDTGARAYR